MNFWKVTFFMRGKYRMNDCHNCISLELRNKPPTNIQLEEN